MDQFRKITNFLSILGVVNKIEICFISNKEVLELMIMGKKISIACPPKDKEGLMKAVESLESGAALNVLMQLIK